MDNELDYLLPFCCLPPENKNEWFNLRDFVESYNSQYKTDYRLESCPEDDNRNSPEPEILLRDGESKMAIERKVIPLPINHVRKHQLWHEFLNRLSDRIISDFSDNLYVFSIKDIDLPNSKRYVLSLADTIASILIKYSVEIRTPGSDFFGYIAEDGSDGATPWSFCIMPELDREDARIDWGIEFSLSMSSTYLKPENVINELPEIRKQLSNFYQSSIQKFSQYQDCHKVLVLEPHTELIGFSVKDLVNLLQEVNVPEVIDQVWIAVQAELNDYELVPDYRLIVDNTCEERRNL